jgi:flagellar hook-associated protein 2
MGGFTPLAFTGISKFSADFQTILSRAVNIARIPVQQLQNQQATLLTKKQLLSDLQSSVGSLTSALSAMGNLGENRAINASTSNASRVSVQLNGANQTGVHTITNITSVAKAAAETSASGYATADSTSVSGTGHLELVVGGSTYTKTLDPSENNLNAIRDWINSLNAGVTASVLNTGSGPTPHYLYISSNATGAKTLQLRTTAGDSGSNILTGTNQGANAEFTLNGIAVSKADNVVSDMIPGVTFSIQSTTGASESVTLTLASDRSLLSTELNNFAARYNQVVDKVNAQIGKAAGLLTGEMVIREVQSSLRALTGYESASSADMKRIADLGLELDKAGKMSFNASKFFSISDATMNSAYTFLGSAVTGFGGLSKKLTQLSDPVSGMIKAEQSQIDTTDSRISKQVEELTARIDYMQKSVAQRLQTYDSLLARLESQQNMVDASIKSVQLALFGRNDE